MLELRGICKTFNKGTADEKPLFQGFGLQVPAGQFVSVVGSNGSGKTTLLNVISGDMPIDGGSVLLDGEDISKKKNYQRAQYIARVFQNPSMGTCPTMTIFENMSIADNKRKPFNLTRGLNMRRKDYYRQRLEALGIGLENRLDTVTKYLSGGQRQALALIMATLETPALLLLDEHTAALDPKSSDTVMELTQKILDANPITTLMVTHNLRYATSYGSRLVMMHEGGIVTDVAEGAQDGRTVEDLLKIFNSISIECGN